MGEVYEAEDLTTGRRVALKALTGSGDALDKKRFVREGRLAAQVSHPNSVYVYGTEEIEGTPVITMELVAGGTLQERVDRDGPLSVSEAVDAAGQMIEGLQAAQAKGVLHRDIKPSNCFLHADGTIKVGDFGLSISSRKEETLLTVGVAVLGTPAYASPEQLQGNEVDVRSDIFSVGATLYYLLTGRQPFSGDGTVQLIAAVLGQTPASPDTIRPEVPKGLSKVVMRCLEKSPKSRYSNYQELRKALAPFSTPAYPLAGLGARLVAGIIDYFLTTCGTVLGFYTLRGGLELNPQIQFMFESAVINFAVSFSYYSISEGVWGSSVGKAALSLRLADREGFLPSLPRVLLRSLVYTVPLTIASMFEGILALDPSPAQYLSLGFLEVLVVLALFSTAFLRPGRRGLHELASGTHVLRIASDGEVRSPVLEGVAESPSGWICRLGPYLVDDAPDGSGGMLRGYDPELRRYVWIRAEPVGSEAVSPERRDLARFGRLRWLNGRRDEEEAWDAYEAPSGRRLLDVLVEPQPWADVRVWLNDLAEELIAAGQDGTLQLPLGLDRLWITTDGRAKILDFKMPEDVPRKGEVVLESLDSDSVACFLLDLVTIALGRTAMPESGFRLLPLRAGQFLRELRSDERPALDTIVSRLKVLVVGPAVVSRQKRLAHLVITGLAPIVMTLAMAGIYSLFVGLEGEDRVSLELSACLNRLEVLDEMETLDEEQSLEKSRLETFILGRFGDRIPVPEFWDQFAIRSFVESEDKARAVTLFNERGTPSPQEFEAVLPHIESWISERLSPERVFKVAWTVGVVSFAIMGGVATILAFFLRGGLLFNLLGMVVVDRKGLKAARSRAMLRSLIAWAPPLVLAIWTEIGDPSMEVSVGLSVLWLAGLLWALARPRRGVQDLVTGTGLVPR